MFWVLQVVGWILIPLGILCVMGGAMSDAPVEGNATANSGAIMFLIGVVLVVFAFIGRHYNWLPV